VTFGDQGAIGGVRISHMSHIDKAISMKLTKTQGRKAVFNFQPLETAKPKVDPAAWANDHIGDIKTTTDADEFATVKAGGVKAMAKLAQSFPDLHKLVLSAYHQQADSFREGKPDADTGEGFTDDDTDPFGLKHFAEDRITDDLIAASQ
jgi:predicted metal-dependent HD superfamily phosphohydrolase